MCMLRKLQLIHLSSSEQLFNHKLASMLLLYEEPMYSNASSLTLKIISIIHSLNHIATPNYTHVHLSTHSCTPMYTYTYVHSCTLMHTHVHPYVLPVQDLYTFTILHTYICVHHVRREIKITSCTYVTGSE